MAAPYRVSLPKIQEISQGNEGSGQDKRGAWAGDDALLSGAANGQMGDAVPSRLKVIYYAPELSVPYCVLTGCWKDVELALKDTSRE